MTSAPSPTPRDLAILDALGEITPEQRKQLAAAFKADPRLVSEHAETLAIVSKLAIPATSIPPMPSHVLTSLEHVQTGPDRAKVFPVRFAWAAAAAILLFAGWWLTRTEWTPPSPDVVQSPTVNADSEALPMGLPAPLPGKAPVGTRRALLVAVEPWPDKEKDPNRGAGWKDLQMMKELLTKKWGFAESDIHQVFNRDATLANVVSAFEQQIISQTKPGDSVVIYWSSHGTQVADMDGDEPDGLDEAYCTFDFDWSKPETWFTDDLFAALLARIRTKDILVITDACHSGGSTRGIEEDGDAQPKAISSGFIPAKVNRANVAEEKAPGHVMLLAACASDEVSYGGFGKGGYFTIQLQSILMAAPTDSLSFQQAVERVRPKIGTLFKGLTLVPGSPKTWTPQFEGPVTKKIATFLNPPVTPPEPPAPPPPPPLPVWQKQSGDIALNLATDKTIYSEGDLMKVTVTPDLDCHLRLYYLSADHQTHQIFPNKFQQDGFVKKGQTVTLPAQGAAFEFKMGAPFGNEILMAVASSVPFTDQAGQEVQNQLFQEFKDTNLESLAHRGISVEETKALTGRALHLYRVEAKK